MATKRLNDEEVLNKNYFQFHLVVLQIFGVPIGGPTKLVWKILYFVYAILMVLLFFVLYTVFELMYMYYNFVDVYSYAFQITFILTHFLGLFKMGLLFIFRHGIDNYCKRLESGIFLPNAKRGGAKETQLVNRATKICNMQATFFDSFLLVMLTLYITNALINNDSIEEYFDSALNKTMERHIRLTPYWCWLPFDTNESPYYEIACAYQISACVFFGIEVGAFDSFMCGILCHIKAQFLILINSLDTFMDRIEIMMKDDGLEPNLAKYRISEMLNDTVELFPEHIQKYADRCFRDCVDHHQQIIELCNEAEDIFSYMMLMQFMGSLMLICFQLFQLSVSSLTSYDSFSMVTYLLLATYQVFIFCWHGNEIMVVSDSLPQAIYETNWLVTSLSTRKSLLIMMTRAYRPIRMTAGKFAFLSLETFVSIIRGAGSYFMVLRSMNEEEA